MAVANKAAINMSVQISKSLLSVLFGVCILWRGTAGSSGTLLFNFLRCCHMVFLSGCTIFDLQRQGTSVCFSTSSTLVISGFFLLLLLFLINNHPDECKGLSHCGLIYISLVINDAEYLFMC